MDAPGTYENSDAGPARQRKGSRGARTERRRWEKLKKLRVE